MYMFTCLIHSFCLCTARDNHIRRIHWCFGTPHHECKGFVNIHRHLKEKRNENLIMHFSTIIYTGKTDRPYNVHEILQITISKPHISYTCAWYKVAVLTCISKTFSLPVHVWKKSLNWKYKHRKYNLFLLTIFTNLSGPALLAGAPEWPNGISTAASVKTRIVQALILVCHDKKYIQFKKWTQALKR